MKSLNIRVPWHSLLKDESFSHTIKGWPASVPQEFGKKNEFMLESMSIVHLKQLEQALIKTTAIEKNKQSFVGNNSFSQMY